ncbi:uncharacterized protein C8Q71DRAFT_180205 [Rhodofomes roseus]|uniref:Uncharacterized protein n=1 Tax=Rhodofomes roseus TaxID=34475 RepID=A0ABQ8K9W7_9APHY|nr:uncharacterized protein C8Q71DRAFT_180205 [Rhodofomes roseus]KAH9833889.1 hypothetical protein C8Q71DRAFT_180205 [Rhodofomes roseus]
MSGEIRTRHIRLDRSSPYRALSRGRPRRCPPAVAAAVLHDVRRRCSNARVVRANQAAVGACGRAGDSIIVYSSGPAFHFHDNPRPTASVSVPLCDAPPANPGSVLAAVRDATYSSRAVKVRHDAERMVVRDKQVAYACLQPCCCHSVHTWRNRSSTGPPLVHNTDQRRARCCTPRSRRRPITPRGARAIDRSDVVHRAHSQLVRGELILGENR